MPFGVIEFTLRKKTNNFSLMISFLQPPSHLLFHDLDQLVTEEITEYV